MERPESIREKEKAQGWKRKGKQKKLEEIEGMEEEEQEEEEGGGGGGGGRKEGRRKMNTDINTYIHFFNIERRILLKTHKK